MTWQDRAACRGMDTDLFFRNPPHAARAVCHRCPVTAACLEFVMAVEPSPEALRFGIWAGTGPAHRAKLGRIRQTIAPRGTS